jgi:probable phosphoglycerate mutase
VDAVAARADRVLERACAAGGVVALFSHGHFLRVLGARWIGQAPSAGAWLGLDTATISCLGNEREQRVLRVWNS